VDNEELRDQAITRIKEKRDFKQHLSVFVIVNLVLNVIWALTSYGGYYWPIWPLLGWGIGLFFHGYNVYTVKPIGEDEIQREMRNLTQKQ
jgi:hypothetical protein